MIHVFGHNSHIGKKSPCYHIKIRIETRFLDIWQCFICKLKIYSFLNLLQYLLTLNSWYLLWYFCWGSFEGVTFKDVSTSAFAEHIILLTFQNVIVSACLFLFVSNFSVKKGALCFPRTCQYYAPISNLYGKAFYRKYGNQVLGNIGNNRHKG
jgi:hypothetical protein